MTPCTLSKETNGYTSSCFVAESPLKLFISDERSNYQWKHIFERMNNDCMQMVSTPISTRTILKICATPNSMKIRYSPEDALKQTQKLYTPKFNLTMQKSQTLQSLSKTLDSASMGHLVHHSNQDHWDTTTKFRNYSPHLKVQNHKR